MGGNNVILNFDKVHAPSDMILNFTDGNTSEYKSLSYVQIVSMIRSRLQLQDELAYELANDQAILKFRRGDFNHSLDMAKQRINS